MWHVSLSLSLSSLASSSTPEAPAIVPSPFPYDPNKTHLAQWKRRSNAPLRSVLSSPRNLLSKCHPAWNKHTDSHAGMHRPRVTLPRRHPPSVTATEPPRRSGALAMIQAAKVFRLLHCRLQRGKLVWRWFWIPCAGRYRVASWHTLVIWKTTSDFTQIGVEMV